MTTLAKSIRFLESSLKPESSRTYLGLIVLLVVLLAAHNSFIQDDAFISFRYAHNLVYHHNFSWNSSDVDKLEGYTNFLWTIIVAVILKIGLDPVVWSAVISIAAGVGTLVTVYSIAHRLTRDFRYALLGVLLLGTNASFNAYMTGGLETQLQTFLICLIAHFAVVSMASDTLPLREFFLLGLVSGIAALTRLDSLLIAGVFYVSALFYRYRRHATKVRGLIALSVATATPMLIILLPWLVWTHSYYGSVLPNSFHLKGRGLSFAAIKYGFHYLVSFVASYQLLVGLLLLLRFYKEIARERVIVVSFVVISVWAAYVIKVGGDFMEYRFMIPILPLFVISLTWALKRLENQMVRFVVILVILAGSLSHRMLFTGYNGIESIRKLGDHVYKEDENWRGIGLKLKELFASADERVVIATTAAGAIPYYSQLKTIDMLGVNDKWIAMNGVSGQDENGFRPGHNKREKLDYYLRTQVNLVFGHPKVKPSVWSTNRSALSLVDFESFAIASLDRATLPDTARIVEIPISQTHSVFALYLRSLPEIEARISNNEIRSFRID